MSNDMLKETDEFLSKMPPNASVPYLRALLGHAKVYEKNLIRLAKDAYYSEWNPELFTEALTQLSDAGELHCLWCRETLDGLCKMIRNGDSLSPIPSQLDISQDIEIRYNPEESCLRVTMPVLLPLKGKWSEYLPGKIRFAMEQFSAQYKKEHGTPLKISPAFVLFVHHYDEQKREDGTYRDYDNQEYSNVLNALHSTLIFNDSAATCITMQMAAKGEKSFTEVFVTPVNRMGELLSNIDFCMYCEEENKGNETSLLL